MEETLIDLMVYVGEYVVIGFCFGMGFWLAKRATD